MLVFTDEWLQDLRRRYDQQPMYQRPYVYYMATHENHENQRVEIESWVSDLPIPKQLDVISRLRVDNNFVEASNELAVGASLKLLGYDVDYSPVLENLTPDWYVHGRNGVPDFIVEVVTVRAGKELQRSSLSSSWIMYAIHEIPVNAMLQIRVLDEQDLPRGRHLKRMSRAVHEWLIKTEPKTGETFTFSGLMFEMCGYEPNAVHALCFGLGGGFAVSSETLKRNIETKLRKYANVATRMKKPLVVAVVTEFLTGLGIDNLKDVLVGKEVMRIATDDQGNCWSYADRQKDGIMITASNKTALSAALLVKLQGHGQFHNQAILNPHATYPLPTDTFIGDNGRVLPIELTDS